MEAAETAARLAGARAGLAALFAGAGHVFVEPAHLQPAALLLDLYGEDLRGRAFLFPDNERTGEFCLRPDFTVPVARLHGEGPGWASPARYAYLGPVFRRQDRPNARPLEYLQAGIERFGDADRPAADAAVFALIREGLGLLGVERFRATVGDLGIAFAAIRAVGLEPVRRDRLMRHFWRPARFHALIAEYTRTAPAPSATRAALLAALDAPEPLARIAAMAGAAQMVGLREPAEILARARALRDEAALPPLAGEAAGLIEAVLAVHGPADAAPARLRDLAAGAGVDLARPVAALEARLAALDAAGIAPASLDFDADFGRALEYYDGFVFEITAADAPGLPPLAGGGRYDAMTVRLGAAAPVPAVGGMIRPEAALAAAEDAAGEGAT